MHNDDMQAFRNLARLAHSPRRDHLYTRRDHLYTRRDPVRNRCCMYSRDRSRRT